MQAEGLRQGAQRTEEAWASFQEQSGVLQELQGKVMEAAAALDASRGSAELCNSQSRRVQDCAGSLMEEVAKAECVSAYPGGEGWSRDRPHRSPPSAKSAPMGLPLTPTGTRLPTRTPPLRPTRPHEDPNSRGPGPGGSRPLRETPRRSPAAAVELDATPPPRRRSGYFAARARRAPGGPRDWPREHRARVRPPTSTLRDSAGLSVRASFGHQVVGTERAADAAAAAAARLSGAGAALPAAGQPRSLPPPASAPGVGHRLPPPALYAVPAARAARARVAARLGFITSAAVTCTSVSRVVSGCLGEAKGKHLRVGRVPVGAQRQALTPRPQWAGGLPGRRCV
ncbi:transmembrane protein 191C isoform X2 [Phyllostomus discolor]|nr:transmembrane protein 191C isoform X2 [Phyllostomus discolor]